MINLGRGSCRILNNAYVLDHLFLPFFSCPRIILLTKFYHHQLVLKNLIFLEMNIN